MLCGARRTNSPFRSAGMLVWESDEGARLNACIELSMVVGGALEGRLTGPPLGGLTVDVREI